MQVFEQSILLFVPNGETYFILNKLNGDQIQCNLFVCFPLKPLKTAYASPTHTTVFPKGASVISQLSLSSRPSNINREL